MLQNLLNIVILLIFICLAFKAFIPIIEKLPNFLYKIWFSQSQSVLNKIDPRLRENDKIVNETSTSTICQQPVTDLLNTKIIHKKCFYMSAIGIFILAAFSTRSSLQLFAYLTFISIIFILIVIDYKTMLLPDELTLPLLGLGLLFNLHGLTACSLENSVYGAIGGYLILWSVFWVFKLLTHKDGMGYGDFKFLAAILAFLGIQYLVPMLLLSSILGLIYVIMMAILNKSNSTKFSFISNGAIPFGPYLGLSAIILLFWGNFLTTILMQGLG